jgi:hypothetical protein
MVGEVCRAIELSGQEVPPEARKVWETFRDEMRAQGKEIHLGGGMGGYFGSGYYHDGEEEEGQEENRKRLARLMKQLESSQTTDEVDIDEQLARMIRSKRRQQVRGTATAAGTGGGKKARPIESKLAAAKAAAERIVQEKKLAPVEVGGPEEELMLRRKRAAIDAPTSAGGGGKRLREDDGGATSVSLSPFSLLSGWHDCWVLGFRRY